MGSSARRVHARRLNKVLISNFPNDWHTSDKGQREQWSKRCANSNKDVANSMHVNDTNNDNRNSEWF